MLTFELLTDSGAITAFAERLAERQSKCAAGIFHQCLPRSFHPVAPGMVIYIPIGDENDKTRLPEFYDGTFNFLKSCGLEIYVEG